MAGSGDVDADRRYRRAYERLEAVYGAREIRVLELAVDRLGARAHPGREGRPPEAVLGTELPPPRELRLRRAK